MSSMNLLDLVNLECVSMRTLIILPVTEFLTSVQRKFLEVVNVMRIECVKYMSITLSS